MFFFLTVGTVWFWPKGGLWWCRLSFTLCSPLTISFGQLERNLKLQVSKKNLILVLLVQVQVQVATSYLPPFTVK